MNLTQRELRFIYHVLKAGENAESADLKEAPEQYVAHYQQYQYLLKTEFKYLTDKVEANLVQGKSYE